MNLCGRNLFDRMRADLRPQGTAPLVRLFIRDSSYYDVGFVERAVERARSRASTVAAGLDEFNELEQLGMRVLLDSAYLELTKGPALDTTPEK